MTDILRLCPKCGSEIPADAPEGGCPGCLLETALGLLPEPSLADGCGSAEDAGTPNANAAPHSKKTARAAELLGELGDYELLEEVGRGGQGVVFRARQKSLHRTVALKVINLGQWASRAHLKRFRREAEAAASLEHPCIVPIYEVGERDGSCYFSMKFVEGGQIDEVVGRTPMSIRQAVELIAKVARTVHYAHEHGIVHRDIKPGNILLDANGEPHLTDFGLARLVESESTVTRTLEVLGTPSYMAPEQAVGNNAGVGKATDVYGIGAVLYQLLTGHPPFAGGTTYQTIKLLLDTEPRSPPLWNRKIDRDLSTICLKCLEKDPERRYASALALAEDLECWLDYEPIRARRAGIFTRGRKWIRRNPSIAVMAAMLLALAAPLGAIIWKREFSRQFVTTGIAVLPFENLSGQKETAAFVDGVQDDILTKLAKIADLKVISRTSVMGYRGKQNMRQIGDELRVSHVLEGSVRRVGARLHMNMQLIDTRTDTHIWAEQYDRDLNDLFAIQSETAQKVAQRLRAKITAAEKLAIERRPTGDLVAFDLYSQASHMLPGGDGTVKFGQAIDLLNQAVARDPSFFGAYCQLAWADDELYFSGLDHTPARLASAEAAIQAAFRLRPDDGETHLARAWHLYHAHLDYDGALAELEVARQTLPNNSGLFETMGFVLRRQGRWEESTRSLERAFELDPRYINPLYQIGLSYGGFRRYAEQKSKFDRILTIEPNNLEAKAERAFVEVNWKADTGPLHQLIDEIRATSPAALPKIAESWLLCALAERDIAAAKEALIACDESPLGDDPVHFTRPFVEGIIARMTNDEHKAQLAFTAAHAEQEKTVQAQADYGPAWCVLGVIDAALGRKEEALREGRRAVELLPVGKDPFNGMLMIKYLAMIAAWVGEKDLACEQIITVVRSPTGGLDLSYGELKLMPFWDPLRGEPCFEKIVASVAPKEIVSK
jgi:TolB-like protein/tRNA A-37 threonylcarbamoyl transferase component Bud32/Tfp pilus assembly protein PilF